MNEEILKVLRADSDIFDIEEILTNKKYGVSTYEYLYNLKFKIGNQFIGIVMAVPMNWNKNLVSFYVREYKRIKYIPHMHRFGELCLFDKEGVLINANLIGIIKECLERIKKILFEGINDINKVDFIKEFDSYWSILAGRNVIKSTIKLDDNIKVIKYKELQKQLKNEKEALNFVVSDNESNLRIYMNNMPIKNGIYIPIVSEEYIYPPDWREKFDINYINNIINNKNISLNDIIKLTKQCGKDLFLLINIKQPDGINSLIAILIKDFKESLICLNNNVKFINVKGTPMGVIREDRDYLTNRGGANDKICDKKVLVIGCGSIGGYLISELIKAGISNICMVDNDILSSNNIYRHLLGMEYVGDYKTTAIINYMTKNLPYVTLTSCESEIEDAINDKDINIEDYDLVISATGNHNVNRWLNHYIYSNRIDTPVIYLWNEVLGIGSHAVYINRKNKGCFECIIGEDDVGIYDKTSYCKRGQLFAKQYRGCTSTFLPYGSIHSLKTVAMGVEIVLKFFIEGITNNYVMSIKGDDTLFKKEGFEVSEKYNNQAQTVDVIYGEKFSNSRCCDCKGN
ncbi:hypothetical protein GKZ28_11865 [Clostridium chromiireducens]|uniref:Uncharacterized protein n=1 Tax=Clostridium chromiireducens TaxID=225345 RepID=A0A964W2S2_9CLOT|nr:ThiF family adenylyltransferase [Clostridium chromiireducens]MVX64387.1 hypothetical protein [Clostridium chromiireducens]